MKVCWRMLLPLMLGVVLPAVAMQGWSYGEYGVLEFAQTGSEWSYTFAYGGTTFTATPGSLGNVTATTTSSGSDAFGAFTSFTLAVATAGELTARYYPATDAFVFLRTPAPGARRGGLPSVWPSFSIADQPANRTRCIGWAEHYFFPGQTEVSLSGCNSGGPLLLFDAPTQSLPQPAPASAALSPLSHFATSRIVNCRPGPKGTQPNVSECTLGVLATAQPAPGASTAAVLVARPGLVRVSRAFGAIVRRYHNTTRLRASGVEQLSYWNDNQAGYSWWTVGPDQEVWGKPEDIYLKLKEGYDKAQVPIRGWEPDNNWIVTYKDGNEFGNGTGVAKNWIGRQWDFNTELYPSGGEAFTTSLGNLSMVYYTNGFNANNSYVTKYRMVGKGEMEPHPTVSRQMYGDLIGEASERYAMEMLFTDFLCYRGPSMAAYTDVPVGEDGEHLWLGGQALAAQDHGVEVQWCMALAHQILMSVEFPSVTNARVNGDGGLDTVSLIMPAFLAATVGLGWSKDNLRTADRCYVDARYHNGTVKWPCGSINAGEGTSGAFKMQMQQTMLAALSLGPVGLADQLSADPINTSATITSNLTLVMATCAATGDLLQPSYPLTPIERMLTGGGGFGDCFGQTHRAYTFGCGANVLATYTAVPPTVGPRVAGRDAAPVATWWTAVGFAAGRGSPPTNITLLSSDLAPMVDQAALPSPAFSDIPTGAFSGNGSAFASEYVWWRSDFVNWRTCADIAARAWTGEAPFPVDADYADGALQVNLAPVINGVALLGELTKVVAVSVYRFAAVGAEPNAQGKLRLDLRGKPGETVQLAYVLANASLRSATGVECQVVDATIGSGGTASVSFP
eukprot:m.255082 g.255082  ORF g.255082 m.255082 type:complete len:849 (+) comp26544_c0_seq1:10-2556(+)